MAETVTTISTTADPEEGAGLSGSQERIFRNTSYLAAAFILQKALSFLYFVFISRILGPVDLGLYDPIKTLIPIMLILIDFSLSVVLVREIAREPKRAETLLANVLGIKVLFALVVLLVMGFFTNFSDYSILVKTVLYLDGVIVALDTFTLTFFAVFRGMQNMKFESLGIIITQVVTVIVGVGGLLLGFDLRVLFVAVLGGSVFNFIFSFVVLRRKLGLRIRLAWDWDLIRKLLRIAIPFAMAAILVKVYSYADRFMLLAWEGQRFEAWYIVAHKYTYALEFIPSAFAASIFPVMSAFYLTSREKLARTFEQAMYYLTILALPISVGIMVLAPEIIVSLSGPAYVVSIQPLRILIAGLIVIFLNFPVGALLNACNKQALNTRNMAIAVAVNLLLNLWLIPQYSFNGAAIAALVSGVLLFFLGLWHVGKIAPYRRRYLWVILGKTALAAGIMGATLIALKALWPFTFEIAFLGSVVRSASSAVAAGIYVVIGAVAYFAVLLALKGMTIQSMLYLFRRLFKRAKV